MSTGSKRYALEMDIGGAWERLPEDGLYKTREEAEREIKDHIAACRAAVDAGELDDAPEPDLFRVVEVEG